MCDTPTKIWLEKADVALFPLEDLLNRGLEDAGCKTETSWLHGISPRASDYFASNRKIEKLDLSDLRKSWSPYHQGGVFHEHMLTVCWIIQVVKSKHISVRKKISLWHRTRIWLKTVTSVIKRRPIFSNNRWYHTDIKLPLPVAFFAHISLTFGLHRMVIETFPDHFQVCWVACPRDNRHPGASFWLKNSWSISARIWILPVNRYFSKRMKTSFWSYNRIKLVSRIYL